MSSGTELEALKAVKKRGGETTVSAVAKDIKISLDYTRVICRSLGMADYLDVSRSEKIKLTPKGWKVLEKKEDT
ncbi:MAG: hypothetical protein ABIL06_12755 [Pseudomonadota bacterium]